jgi:hypothetical protein
MNEHLALKLSPRELDYIAQCLARQPWNEVNALLVNIQQQIQEQQNAHEPKLASIGGSG